MPMENKSLQTIWRLYQLTFNKRIFSSDRWRLKSIWHFKRASKWIEKYHTKKEWKELKLLRKRYEIPQISIFLFIWYKNPDYHSSQWISNNIIVRTNEVHEHLNWFVGQYEYHKRHIWWRNETFSICCWDVNWPITLVLRWTYFRIRCFHGSRPCRKNEVWILQSSFNWCKMIKCFC